MYIHDIELSSVAVDPNGYPKDGLPEIALIGRSNVGKSSLINCISNRKNFARTSSKPGKTRTINFYKCDHKFYIVDLPGYGYAKVAKSIKNEWAEMIEKYLKTRTQLKYAMHLVDIRHIPTYQDEMMSEWLNYYNIPRVIIATKADKISKSKWKVNVDKIRSKIGTKYTDIIIFSSQSNIGIQRVLQILQDI